MPILGNVLCGKHRHRARPNERIHALAKPMFGQLSFKLDMRAHRNRMNAGVGAARRVNGRELTGHLRKRFLDRLLDGWAMLLPLPAHERAAVIFDCKPPARHWRIVPLGMAKPRSSSPGVIEPRPARWTLSGRR